MTHCVIKYFMSFVSFVLHSGPIQTSPEILENAAIPWYISVSPIVHPNPSRKRSFSETLFKPEKFENAGLGFSVDEKHFKNGAFWKWLHHDNRVISLTEFPSKTDPKVTGDCYVFQISPA